MDLANWQGAPAPARAVIEGRYTRLEPLDAALHAETLWQAAQVEGGEARFRYLFDQPPADAAEMRGWVEKAALSADPMFFAVIDRATGRAEGRQALMRIDRTHGVAEIGNIFWGPAIARSRMATEALFLFADHVFSLGYRRFEWKCDNENLPSKKAAARFGFRPEGVFHQHMVVKGKNRDTAWFAILDRDWPELRREYQRWLAPENFDRFGAQLTPLRF